MTTTEKEAKSILFKILAFWLAHPQLRFFQMIEYLEGQVMDNNDEGVPLFYMDNNEVSLLLDKVLANLTPHGE